MRDIQLQPLFVQLPGNNSISRAAKCSSCMLAWCITPGLQYDAGAYVASVKPGSQYDAGAYVASVKPGSQYDARAYVASVKPGSQYHAGAYVASVRYAQIYHLVQPSISIALRLVYNNYDGGAYIVPGNEPGSILA